MRYEALSSPQVLLSRIESLLNENGYFIERRHDFENWVAFLKDGQKMRLINPSFDPTHSDLTPDSSFWIRLIDANGSPVACIANRLYDVTDFAEHIRSLKFLFRRVVRC